MPAINDYLVGRINEFFQGGSGPTHSKLTQVFLETGVDDGYHFSPDGDGPNKQTRILDAFRKIGRNPEKSALLLNYKFQQLQYLALDRLQMLPDNVDATKPGGAQLRAIDQGARDLAQQINELRNLQGTGHGRTLPTGVTKEAAMFVIQQGGLLAEMLLVQLDISTGRTKIG